MSQSADASHWVELLFLAIKARHWHLRVRVFHGTLLAARGFENPVDFRLRDLVERHLRISCRQFVSEFDRGGRNKHLCAEIRVQEQYPFDDYVSLFSASTSYHEQSPG